MAMADARAAIRSRIEMEWTATPIGWANEEFDPPQGSPWLYIERIGVGSVSSIFGSTGKRVAQDDGLIVGSIFYPVGAGDDGAYALAEAFGELFRVQRVGEAQTEAPVIGNSEQGTDEGDWRRVSVSIPFTISYFA